MKNLVFLFSLVMAFLVFSPPAETQAQSRYGASTFPLDTLTSETINFYLPGSYGDDEVNQMATFQLRFTRISDTIMMRIYLEESIDDASSSPDYVTVQTVDNYEKLTSSSTEAKYFVNAPIRGKKMRIRVVGTVGTGSAQVEVDAWVRNKQEWEQYSTY